LERRYLKRVAVVTAASPGIADAYAARYRIPPPTPILNVFPRSLRPPALRETETTGPLTLYWFSQVIGPDRGLEDVVQAMGMLKGCDIRLHLQGSWPAAYREDLMGLASSHGVDSERIVYLPTAPPDDLVHIAARYDIGLSLERRDPINRDICQTNKLFVCLLAGNALALTDTAGQRAIACDISDAAFLYSPGDASALASQLRRWHDDRAALQRAREAAWEAGERRYNWDVEKDVLLGVVERTLSAGGKGHG
jgi:glycosyltransferase involved in cell wall biosynthesis